MLIKDHHLQLLNDVWKQRESDDERLRGGGDDDISCYANKMFGYIDIL